MINPNYLGAGGGIFAPAIEAGKWLVSDTTARQQSNIAAIGVRQQQRQSVASGTSSASAPVQLQNALKALGTMAGDPTLTKLKVDGVIGPNTVKAVNYAITKYGPFGQYFQKGNQHIDGVRAYAGGLAQVITQHIQQRGGHVPEPQVQKAIARVPSGGLVPAPITPPEAPDRRWIWWAVGGGSVLLILVMAASVVKKHKTVAAGA